MADVKVNVKGVNKLVRALNKAGSDIPGEMKKGFGGIADSVASDVRTKVPRRSGRAAGSIVAKGKPRGAALAIGGQRAPYYPWLDFGGGAGPGKRIKRPFIKSGRYVYPTIADHNAEIKRETDELLERVIKGAGFDTRP